MTVYHEPDKPYEGFYVVCCKCGWHSDVNVTYTHDGLIFYCNHCENEVELP